MRNFVNKIKNPFLFYPALFIIAIGILFIGHTNPDQVLSTTDPNGTKGSVLSTSNTQTITASQISIADGAVSVAAISNLSIHNQAITNAASIKISEKIGRVDNTGTISRDDITVMPSGAFTSYQVVEGDTVDVIAAKFDNIVTSQTIRWVNGLKDNSVNVGVVLSIPRVNGIAYVIKDDDTLASIVEKYGSTPELISKYNPEIINETLPVGLKIIVPDGALPETERPEYVAPPPSISAGGWYGGPMMAGNRYAFGNCTYYAYNRRIELGLPVGSLWGNANTWYVGAMAAGLQVDGTPSPGAIFVQPYLGYFGHVGIVESVNFERGTMIVSDMNGIAGFNRVGTKEVNIGWAQFFIH